MSGGQIFIGIKGIVKRAIDGLFYFCAAELLARIGQRIEIEAGWISRPLRQVNSKDLRSLLAIGQIHEKDFIQAPLAQQFRGQLRDVVGRGHDEYRRPFLRKPGQESPEDPSGGPSVSQAGSLGTSEGLV